MVCLPVESSIDYNLFWSAAKIEAFSLVDAPCISFDWDLYLKRALFLETDVDIFGLHPDFLLFPGYNENKMTFGHYFNFLRKGYLDWDAAPINTAICAFNSQQAKEKYTSTALKFMSDYTAQRKPEVSPLNLVLFSDQKLLGMIAKEFKLKTIFENPFDGYQKDGSMYHAWGQKNGLDQTYRRTWFSTMAIHEIRKMAGPPRPPKFWEVMALAEHGLIFDLNSVGDICNIVAGKPLQYVPSKT